MSSKLDGFVDGDRGVCIVPSRRVVHAGLPAVMDLDEAATVRVTGTTEPSVPCRELGHDFDGEGLGFGFVSSAGPASGLEYSCCRDGLDGWLADAAGLDAGRLSFCVVGSPDVRTGEISRDIGEDDVR